MGEIEMMLLKLLADNIMLIEAIKEDYIKEMSKLTSVSEKDIRERLAKSFADVKPKAEAKIKAAGDYAKEQLDKQSEK